MEEGECSLFSTVLILFLFFYKRIVLIFIVFIVQFSSLFQFLGSCGIYIWGFISAFSSVGFSYKILPGYFSCWDVFQSNQKEEGRSFMRHVPLHCSLFVWWVIIKKIATFFPVIISPLSLLLCLYVEYLIDIIWGKLNLTNFHLQWGDLIFLDLV